MSLFEVSMGEAQGATLRFTKEPWREKKNGSLVSTRIEQQPEAVKQWLEEEYPAVEERAKQEKALILWGDEMGLRNDDQVDRSYSPRGKTPIVKVTGNWFGCNMISALSNKGELAFSLFEGSFNVSVFLAFLERLVKQAETQEAKTQKKAQKLIFIVDGHPVHKAKTVKAWVTERKDKLELVFLPGYGPSLNPDELLHQELKATVFSAGRPKTKNKLKTRLGSKVNSIQKQPAKVAAHFKSPPTLYAQA